MFEHIGADLDEEAGRRRAASFTLTLMGLAAVTGFLVTVAAYTAAEVLLVPVIDEPMVELIPEVGRDDPLPALPALPPPSAGGAATEEAPRPEVPDEPAEPTPLDEPVDTEVRSAVAPAGDADGRADGDPNGRPGGVPGGSPDGDPNGRGGAARVFHHSELQVKRRISPEYPQAARDLDLGDQRCLAVVSIDTDGVPFRVDVEGCPRVFEAPTREAMLGWRWYPPRDGRGRVEARTTIAITFKVR